MSLESLELVSDLETVFVLPPTFSLVHEFKHNTWTRPLTHPAVLSQPHLTSTVAALIVLKNCLLSTRMLMHLCVCRCPLCSCVFVYVCAEVRGQPQAFLRSHPSLRQDYLLTWGLPSTLGQPAPGVYPSLSPQCWDGKHALPPAFLCGF